MKVRWYHRIDLSKLRPGGPGHDAMRRAVRRAAYPAFRNEPELAAAVLKSDMSAATINRLAAERMAKQGYVRKQLLESAGASGFDDPQYARASELIQRREERSFWDGVGDFFGGVGDFLSGIGKGALSALGTGLEQAANPLLAPIAAGASSGDQELAGFRDWVAGLSATPEEYEQMSYPRQVLQNALGLLQGPLAGVATAAQGVVDFVQGGDIILGNGGRPGLFPDMSEQQKQLMRRAGLDPDSAVDRYRFYYDDFFGRGRMAISDEQIRLARDVARQHGVEDDVDSIVEYIISGAAGRGAGIDLEGLSPKTQRWVQRYFSPERTEIDDQLFGILADDTATNFGSTFARATGAQPGTTRHQVVSALADLVGLWSVDPLGRSLDAIQAARAARFAIRADELADIPKMVAATDRRGRPRHAFGAAINELLITADNIYLLGKSGREEDIVQAARLRERFLRRRPDMAQMLDAALATRSGAVSDWVPRIGESAAREHKRATQFRRPYSALEARPGTGKPAWHLGRESATDKPDVELLTRARTQLADRMLLGIVSEAAETGRPLYRGRIVLPGVITMGARVRGAFSGILDAITRQDASLLRAIRESEASKASVRMDDLADDAAEYDIRTGQWLNNIPERWGIGAAMRRAQQTLSLNKAFSNQIVTFHDNRGTETMRRLLLAFMDKRHAHAWLNAWSQKSPAGRMAMYRELMTSIVEATGMRSQGHIGRKMAEYLTKGVVSDGNTTLSGQQALARVFENYANPKRNTIRAEGREVAAALWPYQLSDGIQLPSVKQIRIATGRAKLARLLGVSKSFWRQEMYNALSGLTSAWKASKVGTYGAMWRNFMEGVAFQLVLSPGRIPDVVMARRAQARGRSAVRLARNEAIRGARALDRATDIQSIQELKAINDPLKWRQTLLDQGLKAGLRPDQARYLALMTENVDDVIDFASSKQSLWPLVGVVDWIRKQRLSRGEVAWKNTSWDKYITDRTLTEVLDIYESALTSSTSANLILQPGQRLGAGRPPMTTANDIKEAAEVGIKVRVAKPRPRVPNVWVQADTLGDVGAVRWAEAIDRLQQDEIGGPLLRYLAYQYAVVPRMREIRQAAARKQAEKAAGGRETWMFEMLPEVPDGAVRVYRVLKDGKDTSESHKLITTQVATAVDMAKGPKDKILYADVPEKVTRGRIGDMRVRASALKNEKPVHRMGDLRDQLGRAKANLKKAQSAKTPNPATVGRWQQRVNDLDGLIHGYITRQSQRAAEDAVVNIDASGVFSRALAREGFEDMPEVIDLRRQILEADQAGNVELASELQDKLNKLRRRVLQEGAFDASKIRNAEDYAVELGKRSTAWTTSARRLEYDDAGNYIRPEDEAGREGALRRAARDQVEEVRELLGFKRDDITQLHQLLGGPTPGAVDGWVAPEKMKPILWKIARGEPVTAADLRKVPDDLRPLSVAWHTFIPDLGGRTSRWQVSQLLNEGASRWYDFFVGRPLARLWTLPLFQAEFDHVLRTLEPLADAMLQKGLSHETVEYFLSHTAAKTAVNRVFNTTDNVAEHSYFVELVDNYFMFARAMENFFVRFGKAATANPGRLARMWLAAEFGANSGAIYPQRVDSEQGDLVEWFFTYPGSAMGARMLNEAFRAYGINDAIKQPVFAGAKAPVKWLNPSLQNPIGISANPIFGVSLRIMRHFAPSTWTPGINKMIYAFEGGEEFFATQSILKQILPSGVWRLWEGTQIMPRPEMAAKLNRNAMFAVQVVNGAGLGPGPNATSDEIQNAMQATRVAAHNSLFLSALLGFFGPAATLVDSFDTAGPIELPEVNKALKLAGINSIRDEFWALVSDASRKYGSESAYFMAMEEWARRYPKGKLIYNPEAFTKGTSQLKGAGEDSMASIPRTMQMLEWTKQNIDFLNRYSTLFPFLVPAVDDGYFDAEANRIMYQMGLLESKSLERFYAETVNSGFISEWWDTWKRWQAGELTNDEWYEFDAEWKQLFPKAAEEKDRRRDPQYVHTTLAVDLKNLVEDDNPSPGVAPMIPTLREIYQHYADYREEFLSAEPWDRSLINKRYREEGNRRWLGGPLEELWRVFAVYEGTN